MSVQGLNLLFSSAHSTMARSGGFRYRPTMVSSFSAKRISLLSLNVRTRCGLRPWACQMRRTLASLMPAAAAIVRVLQCVALAGLWRIVMSTTRFTWSSVIVRVLPGREASFCNAAIPPSRNRLRQRATFSAVTPSSCAISLSCRPSAARNTIRARSTTRAGRERPRASRSTAFRTSEFSSTGRATRIVSSSHCMDARHS